MGGFVTDETVPFDKDHLITQIEAGGGVVLEKFDLDVVREFLNFVAHHLYIVIM